VISACRQWTQRGSRVDLVEECADLAVSFQQLADAVEIRTPYGTAFRYPAVHPNRNRRRRARPSHAHSHPRWKMVYNRSRTARVSAPRSPRPPRIPALRRSERCPHAERPPGTGRRPWAREYNPLSLKKIVPAAGSMPGSDESNKRLFVRHGKM